MYVRTYVHCSKPLLPHKYVCMYICVYVCMYVHMVRVATGCKLCYDTPPTAVYPTHLVTYHQDILLPLKLLQHRTDRQTDRQT